MTTLLILAFATFVGNDACRPCHSDLVRRYEATPMARSTAPVSANVPAGRFKHAASGIEYEIGKGGRVTSRRGAKIVVEQFDYIIGSGAAGFSYLISRDRYLYQAPITWYSQARRWDAAPGYQQDPVMAWDRPVDPSCLLCHASGLNHIYNTVNRYAEKPFRQGGVSCERCHGPGSDHVASAGKMVVPTRLDPERRDDICRQCHLMGAARIEKEGRTFAQYRPGDRLAELVSYFVADDPEGPALRTTSHVEKLNASRCKQASGDKLWCGTCHDVHTMPSDASAWYRAKCEGCHDPQHRPVSKCSRGPACIACHMPKSTAVDAGHGAFTDHTIARYPGRKPNGSSNTWKLKPFGSPEATKIELAKAYLQLYQQTKDERQKKEAMRLVNEVAAK
jgi:hypothetical protein